MCCGVWAGARVGKAVRAQCWVRICRRVCRPRQESPVYIFHSWSLSYAWPGWPVPGAGLEREFSSSVVSDSLGPHGLQHARPLCPSPTPTVYSNSCPLTRWSHPTISFSVISLSSRLQSFPASGSFQMSQFFTSGDQTTGVSDSALVLPMNI